jgi:hypothetical protein
MIGAQSAVRRLSRIVQMTFLKMNVIFIVRRFRLVSSSSRVLLRHQRSRARMVAVFSASGNDSARKVTSRRSLVWPGWQQFNSDTAPVR